VLAERAVDRLVREPCRFPAAAPGFACYFYLSSIINL
jgi:hypothetical protein